MEFDAFISHASEDKDAVARPLAAHLLSRGYRVWFDEFELRLGDSLRDAINRGLSKSRFGIVVLSPAFFAKRWTVYELDGLTAVEMERDGRCILPVWHELSRAEVFRFSPVLADRLAVLTTLGLEGVTRKLCEELGEPSGSPVPMKSPSVVDYFREDSLDGLPAEKIKAMIDDSICPRCGQTGEIFGFDGSEGDECDWFECGSCGLFHVLHPLPSG